VDLLAETVERLAVLCGELLRKGDVLVVPFIAILVGEARAESAHVFRVEVIPSPQVLAYPLDEFLGDGARAHRDQV
jgi:hypothetical protein